VNRRNTELFYIPFSNVFHRKLSFILFGINISQSFEINYLFEIQKTRNNSTKTKIKRILLCWQKLSLPQKSARGARVVTRAASSSDEIRPEVIKNVWISDGEIFVRRFRKTALETVKTSEFADLLFPARRNNL
jgi:hypothetical protein